VRELAGIVLIIVLVLVGAVMPLRYTARMHLPRKGQSALDRRDSVDGNAT
jgi:hypothetical protein